VVLLSSAWPLTRIALALGATPLWFAEGRAVLSGVTAALIVVARGRLRVPGRADLPALAYIGFVAGPLGTWCVVEATAKLPTIVSSVGFLTTPAVSLVLASLLLGEAITADLLAGSALIIGGVAIAAFPAGSVRSWSMAVTGRGRQR
jgi:drug/metabolite transporter (DMT)-like permease